MMASEQGLGDTFGDVLWLYIHLPKTGGTTFKGHLRRHLTWDETFVELSRWGRVFRRSTGRPPFGQCSSEQRGRAQVLAGRDVYYGIHRLVPGKQPRYLTFLRDPAARCVSMYNFRRGRGDISSGFESWYLQTYNRAHRNDMAQFYAERLMNVRLPANHEQNLPLAKKLLDLCWYVGITEQLDRDLIFLFAEMGLPTAWRNYRVAGQPGNALEDLDHPKDGEVIHKHYTLEEDVRQRIRRDHPMDVELYRYALELNETACSGVISTQR